jgi:3-hydroxyacyl-CoA dehydrogenase/3a,7a,12a-trihydroxy-5b-cholest-24-enoyl-CoA hydratase
VVAALKERLQKNGKLSDEVRASVQFIVREPDASFGVDLQKGPGSLVEGKLSSPTTTLTLADEDLAALAKGEVGVKELFQHGKLRVDGDVGAVHRLGFLQKLI